MKQKINLILKFITTIYLLMMVGWYTYNLFIDWDGICLYIIGFTLFNVLNLWSKKQSEINIIYIVLMWLDLCIRYICLNINLFDYIDFIVVAMQLIPICSTILNYSINNLEVLKEYVNK
jgi:hypothetical protein